jgi:hypothetical protein
MEVSVLVVQVVQGVLVVWAPVALVEEKVA